jgi:hypothetical protein
MITYPTDYGVWIRLKVKDDSISNNKTCSLSRNNLKMCALKDKYLLIMNIRWLCILHFMIHGFPYELKDASISNNKIISFKLE